MSIFKFVILLIVLSLVSCTTFMKNTPTATYKTPDEVMEAYLSALYEKDDEGILDLIISGHDAKLEIHDRIQRYGGSQLENVQIEYEPTESSHFILVDLQGNINLENRVETVNDRIVLQFDGDYWFIVLGKPRDGLSTLGPPASVDRNTREQY